MVQKGTDITSHLLSSRNPFGICVVYGGDVREKEKTCNF